MNYFDECSAAMIKAYFGINAIHIPLNLVIQAQGEVNGQFLVTVVGQSSVAAGQQHPLQFGSKRIHQLVLGDAIIRPRLVLDSDHFQGAGLGGLLKDMTPDNWIDNPHGILLKP